MNNKVYLSLGSNLGNKKEHLQKAIGEINSQIGKVLKIAKLYESEPWGFENENWFLNTAIIVDTNLNAQSVLNKCLLIEAKLGRQRNNLIKGYSSRIIDIDILFFNNEIINLPQLSIPHPHLHKRKFVLFPLHDICANFIHPLLNKTITELIKNCDDTTKINKIGTLII